MDANEKYNLTAAECVVEMTAQLEKVRADKNSPLILALTPDEAYETGYEAALFDLKHFSGPSPKTEFGDAAGKLAEKETREK